MLSNNKRLSTLVFLFICNTPLVFAETLQEAWKQAIENNHRIKSAKAATNASRQQLFSAQGQRLPELNIGGGYTQLSATPEVTTDVDGQAAQFPTGQDSSGKAEAIVTLPVYTGGRISHDIGAAEASLRAAQSSEAASVQDIKMQVAQAFIKVLRAESAVHVAQSHVDSLAAHEQDVKNLHAQGMVARNDLLSAQVELANARQHAVLASNQLDVARSFYNQLLNRPLSQSVVLVQVQPDVPKGKLVVLSQQALQQRPELVTLTRQIESLQQQAKGIHSGLLPQLAINGGYQYQENRYQVHEGMWMVNVGMQWKLFYGSTRHKSDAIVAQAEAIREQREDLRTRIAL